MALAVLAEGGKGFVCCDSALEFSALSPRAHWNWGHVALRLILVPFPSRSLWPGPPASFRVDTGLTFLIPGEGRCKEGVFGLESAWGMLGEGCLIKGVWPQAWGWSKNGLDHALVWEEGVRGREGASPAEGFLGVCASAGRAGRGSGAGRRAGIRAPLPPARSLGSGLQGSLCCPCPFWTHRRCCDLLLRGGV